MIHEAQITYFVLNENAEEKVQKENYVMEAESFTECEMRLARAFGHLPNLDIVAVRRSNIKEVANGRTADKEVLWLAELQDTFVDDRGNKKHSRYKILFYSTTFDMAKRYIAEYITQGYDLELVSLKLTKFKDVIQ